MKQKEEKNKKVLISTDSFAISTPLEKGKENKIKKSKRKKAIKPKVLLSTDSFGTSIRKRLEKSQTVNSLLRLKFLRKKRKKK